MITNKQQLTSMDIKIMLLKAKKPQTSLLPTLQKKYPHLKIQQPHISMALSDKFPPMLDRIREVVSEI